MDPQLIEVLNRMTSWFNLLAIVSITGFAGMYAYMIYGFVTMVRIQREIERDIRDLRRDR